LDLRDREEIVLEILMIGLLSGWYVIWRLLCHWEWRRSRAALCFPEGIPLVKASEDERYRPWHEK